MNLEELRENNRKKLQEPNRQQLEIINFNENRNVGIIAGPGSGKTFVIIEKIRFYLSNKIEPRKILLVTYTNRGIIEIKQRINKFVKAKREFEYAGTLHSICKKFLEREFKFELSELLNWKFNKLIIQSMEDKYFFLREEIPKQINEIFLGQGEEESDQSVKISRDIAAEIFEIVLEETENALSRNKIENYLNSGFKLKTEEYQWFSPRLLMKIKRFSFPIEKIQKVLKNVFNNYQKKLDEKKLFDFDDLIIYFHYLVSRNPIKKEIISSKFEKILVDEFQDMNFLQLLIIAEISNNKKNILFVGDPNQAIYGFQGAYPEIFNYFKTNIDLTTIFFNLSQNYRSTKNILDFSHKLITKNDQKGIFNQMFTENESGKKVNLLVNSKRGGLMNRVYSIIKNLEADGVDLNQIAIISRTHMETKYLRRWFMKKGLKFLDFNFSKYIFWNYESYFLICLISLRFSGSSFAIKFILEFYFKKWEIPEYFLQQIEDYSPDVEKALNDLTSSNFENKWTSPEDKGSIAKIRKLWRLIKEELRKNKQQGRNEEVDYVNNHFEKIINSQDELKEWIKEHINSPLQKEIQQKKWVCIDNISQFYKVMSFYSNSNVFKLQEIVETLLVYVKHFVSHVTESSYLNFSTVHGAKGCEFDYVFILNLIENKFPKHYAQTQQDLEEERRVLFVGMTRAKKELWLVSDLPTKNLALKGKDLKSFPKVSKFLTELECFRPDNRDIKILTNLTNDIPLEAFYL
ncbi:ATP-dependent helicase [Mycoplasma suis]|uniref:DNA 3'-5' helicase n=1 Tax=Mycoplasma suis (strain Illinois) TaxID=768700 RepID=F0QQS4_MYCSL|nr:ATP-dependent helicase [Mycoplasma suis]ADX97844.1 DNA helicase II [Mycoplasma suis str. Illinois]